MAKYKMALDLSRDTLKLPVESLRKMRTRFLFVIGHDIPNILRHQTMITGLRPAHQVSVRAVLAL